MPYTKLDRPVSHHNVRPTVYMDNNTFKVLKRIKRSGDKGITWGKLQKRFGEYANIYVLDALTVEMYIVTQNEDKEWQAFDTADGRRESSLRSFCAARGNEIIENRRFNFWKWVIPTLISIAALVVSVLAVLLKQSPPPAG